MPPARPRGNVSGATRTRAGTRVNGPTIVWIVEDRDLLRDSCARVVDAAPGLRCGGAFRHCEAALAALAEAPVVERPDVVLMDIELPGMSGVEGTREITARSPDTRVVMLTVHEDRDNVFEALCAGASGYVVKPATAAEIVGALRALLDGEVPMSPAIARRVLTIFRGLRRAERDYGLSVRESEVLEHLVRARTMPDIATSLDISVHTAGNHVRNIYRKLQVHSRAGAVAKAVRERLVDP